MTIVFTYHLCYDLHYQQHDHHDHVHDKDKDDDHLSEAVGRESSTANISQPALDYEHYMSMMIIHIILMIMMIMHMKNLGGVFVAKM